MKLCIFIFLQIIARKLVLCSHVNSMMECIFSSSEFIFKEIKVVFKCLEEVSWESKFFTSEEKVYYRFLKLIKSSVWKDGRNYHTIVSVQYISISVQCYKQFVLQMTDWQAFLSVYKHESILDCIIFSLAEDMKLVKHYCFPAHKTIMLQNQSSEDCHNSPTAMTGKMNR